MIETLTRYGFLFIGTCHCSGALSHKYKNGEHKVYWKKGSMQFHVTKYGRAITNYLPESTIANELEKIFPLSQAV